MRRSALLLLALVVAASGCSRLTFIRPDPDKRESEGRTAPTYEVHDSPEVKQRQSARTHLLLLGALAAKNLTASNDGILKLRGRWFDLAPGGLPAPVPALATLHPAYLLRQPAQKRLAWRDLLSFRTALDRRG